jgi:cystathionine gamma-synthase
MSNFETDAIHAGQDPDPTTGAVIVPIYATSTYAQPAPGKYDVYDYSRTENPTRTAFEQALTALEGADRGGALSTASGMAATALVGYLLKPGDHVVLPNDAYGGTFRYWAQVAGEQGIEWSVVDQTNPENVAAAMRPATKVVWVETPTNPLLRVVDIEAIAAMAGDATVVVDNTFATTYLQRPLALGADLVLHSTTKYIGGHSDLVGGALVTNDPDLLERLAFMRNAAGPIPGPFDTYLALRGLKTLGVRMDRHCSNAVAVADFLANDSRVAQVYYPGLTDHPNHAVAAKQMTQFGGMVSFLPAGGTEAAHRICVNTRYFILAESLGGVESLIEVPAAMTHMSVEGTDLEVPAELVRLSVGIEHIDDLLADLDEALG